MKGKVIYVEGNVIMCDGARYKSLSAALDSVNPENSLTLIWHIISKIKNLFG